MTRAISEPSQATLSIAANAFEGEDVGGRHRLSDTSVTVVIPVWDGYVAVVQEAIASVIAQKRKDWRLVIIDNASTQRLPRLPASVTVERLDNRLSVGAARNQGLALADSRFILFLDADDVITPGTLELMLSRIHDQPKAVACCCRVTAWNPRTGRLTPLAFPSLLTSSLARWHHAFRLYVLMTNRMPTTGCMLMRTDVAREAGGFLDADYAEDWGLNVGLALRGSISFIPHVGRLLRVHTTSLRSRSRDRSEVQRAFLRIRDRVRKDPATPPKLRRSLPLLALYHRLQILALTPGGRLAEGDAHRLVGETGPLEPYPDEVLGHNGRQLQGAFDP